MNKLMKSALAGTTLAAICFGSTSAYAVVDVAEATATVLTAIGLNQTATLNFAKVVPDTAATGTIVISTAGVRTCNAPLVCAGTPAAAAFEVTGGTTGEQVNITVESTATLTGAGDPMDVSGLASDVPNVTLTAGADTFTVGGTLTVGISQAAGTYNGDFDVTALYN